MDAKEQKFFLQYVVTFKLELESDVSPCEQYSLREMARTKIKYEN
jgi:hypothetical protein